MSASLARFRLKPGTPFTMASATTTSAKVPTMQFRYPGLAQDGSQPPSLYAFSQPFKIRTTAWQVQYTPRTNTQMHFISKKNHSRIVTATAMLLDHCCTDCCAYHAPRHTHRATTVPRIRQPFSTTQKQKVYIQRHLNPAVMAIAHQSSTADCSSTSLSTTTPYPGRWCPGGPGKSATASGTPCGRCPRTRYLHRT
jgi:hypothetical protein